MNKPLQTPTTRIPSDNSYLYYLRERGFPDTYVVIDFETTGLNPWSDTIIQIAAVRFENNKLTDKFITYVDPERPIPLIITQITGIDDATVHNQPKLYEAIPKLLNFINDDVLIAHNASFDLRFLNTKVYQLNLPKQNNKVIDTLQLSRKYLRDLKNHKLETIKHFFGLELSSHQAYDDCLTCAKLYQYCKDEKNRLTNQKKHTENISSLAWYQAVEQILLDAEKDIKLVRYQQTATYFDIKAFYSFVRLKLKGNKKYLLTHREKSDVIKYYSKAICEPAPKSEKGLTRIILNTPQDLINYNTLIIEAFDETLEAVDRYRKTIAIAEKNIEEYLGS